MQILITKKKIRKANNKYMYEYGHCVGVVVCRRTAIKLKSVTTESTKESYSVGVGMLIDGIGLAHSITSELSIQ